MNTVKLAENLGSEQAEKIATKILEIRWPERI